MIKLNKYQLDYLSTVVGAVGGISVILGTNGYLDTKLTTTIAGICGVLGGILMNRPATAFPTTEDVEEKNIRRGGRE